jgi:hypothetical protein
LVNVTAPARAPTPPPRRQAKVSGASNHRRLVFAVIFRFVSPEVIVVRIKHRRDVYEEE